MKYKTIEIIRTNTFAFIIGIVGLILLIYNFGWILALCYFLLTWGNNIQQSISAENLFKVRYNLK